jgi:hypothetical protein
MLMRPVEASFASAARRTCQTNPGGQRTGAIKRRAVFQFQLRARYCSSAPFSMTVGLSKMRLSWRRIAVWRQLIRPSRVVPINIILR